MKDSGFDPISIEILNKRLNIVTLVVIGVFSILVLRLWLLQVIKGPSYRVQSENNRIHLRDIPPFRGMIFDRNGELLVDNRPSYDLYIIPEEIQDKGQLLINLESLIHLAPDWIDAELDRHSGRAPFKPVLIKESLSRDELAVIETHLFNLNGVMIQIKPQRNYILGKFASHVIGYLGEINERELSSGQFKDNKPGDLIGKYGVEGKWQKYLQGLRGGEQVEVDAAGRRLRVISLKPSHSGLNVTLTIDKTLQLLAENSLLGKKGAIVAMNPNNGEILALASGPAFDPNLFIGGIDRAAWKRIINSKDYPLQDRAIAGMYPPGSTFKIVVLLAGLQEGVIDPEEEVICYGRFKFGNRFYNCWKKQGHGKVALHKALVESCDVYFYKMGYRLGLDKIAHYADMLGLGKRSKFDLGGEQAGLVPTRAWKLRRWGEPWQAGETISLSIGQSFMLVTPLQMARLISAVFNGGKLYQPKVVKWIGKGDEEVYKFTPSLQGKIDVKPENMTLVKEALTDVVHGKKGTGARARVKGIKTAGKTGTAQVVKLEFEKSFGKEEEVPMKYRDHAWFVALAPVENPGIAIAILVEHGGHGSSAAAPIAKELIEAYLGIHEKGT